MKSKRMIPYLKWFILLVLLAGFSTPTPSAAAQPATVRLYDSLDLQVDLSADVENPYDPNQVDLVGIFTAPDGATVTMPGFLMQPYEQTCTADCAHEELTPSGSGEWHVRFTPDQVGDWQYTIEARVENATQTLEEGSFTVVKSDKPGFVRMSANPRYFAFDSGQPYFPIGENLAWALDNQGGIFAYERWLDRLNAAGANYARLNIDVPWFIGLDWPGPVGNYDGAQVAAWRLDTILEMAEARGIYLQLVLIWHQGYAENPGDAELTTSWAENPYNSANGGPLNGPSAIFFDATARKLLHQRLRYIVARWGYSPQIFAWDVVDEIDMMTGYTPSRSDPWLVDLVDYLRQIDPYRHLVTAGTRETTIPLWDAAALDFAQFSFYQSDPVAGALNTLGDVAARANRPVLLTAFSLDLSAAPTDADPEGLHVRDMLWAAALSGSAGGAMPWWWDSYIDQQNLYALFTPLAQFAQTVPWTAPNLQPVEAALVAPDASVYTALRVDNFNRELAAVSPSDTIYRLTADGPVPAINRMSSYLYGASQPERSRPQTFQITPPVDTELRIGIRDVAPDAPAQLVVSVDGNNALQLDLSPASTNLLVTLPLSAGTHTVIVDNVGQGWLQLDYLEVAHYHSPLRAVTLADRSLGTAFAWIQYRAASPLPYQLWLFHMPAGTYRVAYWDPITGFVIGDESISVEDNTLRLNLPAFDAQLAVQITRIAGPDEPLPEAPVTRTPQVSLTPTPTFTATATITPTPSFTPSPTQSATPTPTPTVTRTPTSTQIPEPTPSPTRTRQPVEPADDTG